MSTVSISYVCGCGFRTHKLEEAIAHVDKSRHMMSITGSIKAGQLVVRATATGRLNVSGPNLANVPQPEPELAAEVKSAFMDLRSRMAKR